ncbi:flagellar assembly protein FliH [Candidatus Scalindua japonica]|uniref:Flagellar assembly protein FliH n=1 Tax=Candidatus Scalindua japonica TaxID=1284222 RepID=A0A286TVW3_9BACT|nr:FliH/SctL family protein [Candidatus Scalindua japonica]GAX60046.1 flagellar assembly protein FliH [Candidatus Scalindua japonica]
MKVYINPDDAEGLQKMKISGISNEEEACEIVSDSNISRGGCKVITDCGGVDARIETRWNEIVLAFAEHDLKTESGECQ